MTLYQWGVLFVGVVLMVGVMSSATVDRLIPVVFAKLFSRPMISAGDYGLAYALVGAVISVPYTVTAAVIDLLIFGSPSR